MVVVAEGEEDAGGVGAAGSADPTGTETTTGRSPPERRGKDGTPSGAEEEAGAAAEEEEAEEVPVTTAGGWCTLTAVDPWIERRPGLQLVLKKCSMFNVQCSMVNVQRSMFNEMSN